MVLGNAANQMLESKNKKEQQIGNMILGLK